MAATDLVKLKTLLQEFGVSFTVEYRDNCIEVYCNEGSSKVKGYPGFHTIFEFNLGGKFIEMGAWD